MLKIELYKGERVSEFLLTNLFDANDDFWYGLSEAEKILHIKSNGFEKGVAMNVSYWGYGFAIVTVSWD